MQLMRWSITRRLESRGERQRRDARICQQDENHITSEAEAVVSEEKPELNTLQIGPKSCDGEDNDSASEGEESTSGIALGEDPVDLTAARSHHEDELDEREPDDASSALATDLPEDDDVEEPEESDAEGEEGQQQQPRSSSTKKLRQDAPTPGGADDDEEGSRKRIRLCQDAENNNSFVEGGATAPAAAAFPATPGTSHVTLEALQNTKVAVAQFAATALAGGADSEAALQELAVLQNTLYTLQHQQVFQLQLISQLQQQLSITAHQAPGASDATAAVTAGGPTSSSRPDSKETSPSPGVPTALIHPKPLSSLTSPQHSRPPSLLQQQQTSPSSTPLPQEQKPTSGTSSPAPPMQRSSTSPPEGASGSQMPIATTSAHQMPALCSISSSLASSIITNNDPLPLHEPNTLEMLQKRAQEVLDNASQGLLANNLADELAFRGSGGKNRMSPYDGKSGGRGEPFFKHRCRYCGKVFGSDSALQIHIRSHTGERPFKCNVCGSRFTTKGNLKVHFQRHKDKFPHVKMNPNPVPEHLDKYHPPLLQQLAACGQRPPGSPPPPPLAPPAGGGPHLGLSAGGPNPFHPNHGAFLPPQPPLPLGLGLPGLPPGAAAALYRSPLLNSVVHPPPRLDTDQDMPENLSKPMPPSARSPSRSPTRSPHTNSHHSYHNEHSQRESREDHVKTEHEQSPSRDRQQQQPRPGSREGITPKNEPEDAAEGTNDEDGEDFDADPSTRKYLNSSPLSGNAGQQMYEDCSMDSKMSGRVEGDQDDLDGEEDGDDQPADLSRTNPASMLQQSMIYPGASPGASSNASTGSLQTSFANILFPGLGGHHPSQPQPPGGVPGAPSGGGGDLIDPARDPAIYSNLLPRPGSNDNSWESLIEITKTSETSKLQQLVDNIEHKLTDPNQCIICQRVLSCKSALQMHYRTHTGERPFKCRICSRAFTTKGNLKTHMGVHRAKPPLRLLHQCTVCHKKFANSFVLQQHVNLHTNDPTELTPEQIRAHEVHDFAPAGYPGHPLAALLPGGFPPLHPGAAGFPLGFPPTARQHALERHAAFEHDPDSKDSSNPGQLSQHQHHQRFGDFSEADDIEEDDDEQQQQRPDDSVCSQDGGRRSSLLDEAEQEEREQNELDHEPRAMSSSPAVGVTLPSFSTSLAALESQVRTITTMASTGGATGKSPPPVTSALLHQQRYNGSEKSSSPPGLVTSTPLDLTPRASSTPATSLSPPQHHPGHPFGMFAGLLHAVSSSPAGINSVPGGVPGAGVPGNPVSPGPAGIGPLASLTSSAVRAATSSYNPLGLAVGGTAVRGNTTCNICYKTFACNSALEIHYRSHTKERPFKCTICDRGFSTKGNMKQHMLTHKIRDMPHHLFGDAKQQQPSSQASAPQPPNSLSISDHQSQHQPQHHQQQHERSRSPVSADEATAPLPPMPPSSMIPVSSQARTQPSPGLDGMISGSPPKKVTSPTDADAHKRPPSMPSKHLCQVCNKNFSSSSALQIHMRTHTGDKPFQCTICQKAFTTKGNLKVHMGTHMWTNGASRRGRRMSLDIPSLPITPKDSEFLQRRPDLFYPYLPAPFLNGMPQKLNEIPGVIPHGAGPGSNGLPAHPAVSVANKYAGLFGSVYAAAAGLAA
ncbi:hypothetical protein QAD02_015588 [Eretmocerus hayati]|uniref:Uncharacterized protein n=1 Tax=Eretmocerus hayati TaxID=131215 RepID=A0ACC2P9Y1_9HYME|nr:hypothetical protein QAD02_015588 [Eretmocerus hayati]